MAGGKSDKGASRVATFRVERAGGAIPNVVKDAQRQPGGELMTDPALAAQVAKLGVKIDGLGEQMHAIGQHVATLAADVVAARHPTTGERIQRLLADWGPVIAFILAGYGFSERLKTVEQTELKLTEQVGQLTGAVSSLKDSISDLRHTPPTATK